MEHPSTLFDPISSFDHLPGGGADNLHSNDSNTWDSAGYDDCGIGLGGILTGRNAAAYDAYLASEATSYRFRDEQVAIIRNHENPKVNLNINDIFKPGSVLPKLAFTVLLAEAGYFLYSVINSLPIIGG